MNWLADSHFRCYRADVVLAGISTVILFQADGYATSSGPEYSIDISFNYQIEGDRGGFFVMSRETQEPIVIPGDTNGAVLYAFFDVPEHLALCKLPRVYVRAPESLDWKSLYPCPGAVVVVVDKSTDKTVGPLDEAELGKYCKDHRIEFDGWTTADELAEAARSKKMGPFAYYSVLLVVCAAVILLTFMILYRTMIATRADMA